MGRCPSLLVVTLTLTLALAGCAGHHMGHGGSHGRVDGSMASDIPIPWHSLTAGKALALEQKRPIIVDFYAPEGCSRCDKMAQHVWSNPEIAEAVNRDFVLVRMDLTQNMTKEEIELGKKYDYGYDCLLIFLDAKGEVIEDVSGKRMCFADFVQPEWFIGYLNRAKEVSAARVP